MIQYNYSLLPTPGSQTVSISIVFIGRPRSGSRFIQNTLDIAVKSQGEGLVRKLVTRLRSAKGKRGFET